ncbi:TetR/AcrR family transcriptional regulator [Paenibacillaceae bacterium WGS1546]|uniref:TetR/AcrR family transcriptional regulator n=1 Tax=Cohnella sp. WGS1546 TaxID=3366810 RepID=UPI00372CF124
MSHNGNLPRDRRILRTQQQIADAFLALCSEKEYESIIIKDITERANVNRSTFYAHYEDKDHLLRKMTGDKLRELASLSRESIAYDEPSFDAPDPYFVALFEHLTANRTFYGVMLGKVRPSLFSDPMREVVRESFFARVSAIDKDQKLLVPLDLLLDYISYSVHGIIRKWLVQPMVYSPDHMSLQLTRLSMLGIYRAMGVPVPS